MNNITFAGVSVSREQVSHTLRLFLWYRRFIRSHHELAHLPFDWTMQLITKTEARKRLWAMIEEAINRKGDLHFSRGRKDTYEYQLSLYRDCQRVRDRVNHRIIVRQFETDEVRQRFGHLLTRGE